MKAYLRDAQTRLWYAGPNRWVVGRKLALEFRSLRAAESAAAEQPFEKVELILTDGGANGETIIPLAGRCGKRGW